VIAHDTKESRALDLFQALRVTISLQKVNRTGNLLSSPIDWGTSTIDIDCIQVLEAASPRPRYGQAWFPQEAVWQDQFQASLFGYLMAIFSLCLSCHLPSMPLCFLVQNFPFSRNINHITLGSSLLLALVLDYLSKDPLSK
jgi:hypothetical protein